jgi:pyruvate,water dikinase
MLCTFDDFREPQHGGAAGGKGRVLARLFQAGHPVPDGFIILASAFDNKGLRESAREQLLSHFQRLTGNDEQNRIEGHSLPGVAVRSSALQEDSSKASFAGEFETVLNVATDSALIDAIQRVYASSNSDRVKSYTEAQHLPEIHRMAIVVQRMVAPDYSGVLFTADPISGDPDTMHGNLTEGAGEKLVSGQITADTFTIHSPSGAYDGPDYFEPHQGALFKLASILEQELHSPQDIEWAIENGRLYLLQSRPITVQSPTPEVWNDTLHLDCLWTNTNIGEAMGGMVTPFSWSVILELFAHGMGTPTTPAAGLVAGRGYINVSILVSTLGKLGLGQDFILDRFSQLLGQIPDHLQIPAIKVSWGELLSYLFRQLSSLLRSMLTQKRFLKWIQEECPAWCEMKFKEIEQCRNNQDLLEFYDGFELTGFRTFTMVVFFANLFLFRQVRLKSELARTLDSEELETMLSGLGGEQQLQSMGPLMAISAMMKGQMTREEFSRSYGHRGPMEAEFAQPRTGEDPDWINKLISQWQDANPNELLLRQQNNRDDIWKSIEQRSRRQARRLRKLFSAAATQAQNREYLRSEMVRQGWVVRKWVEKIAAVNDLEDHLYYLSKNEVLSYLHGDTSVLDKVEARRETFRIYRDLPPLPNIISGRFDPFLWLQDPDRRTDYFDAHRTYEADEEDIIRGFPGSAGLIKGTVRVLTSHEQMDEFQPGEILVTSFTNVGWTPLFPRAAAIITDIGAPLSHAAIVARELGIPAVVGTGSATMKLKTGDRVKVNGSQGFVEIL